MPKKTISTTKLTLPITNAVLKRAYKKTISKGYISSNLKIISSAFSKYPTNTSITEVAIKICVIDSIFSTHLSIHNKKITVEDLAKYICSIPNFDLRVSSGDKSLVDDLASGHGMNVHLLSFASKYCQLHNSLLYKRDDYSRYDNNVCENLPTYLSALGITTSKGKTITINHLKGVDYCTFDDYIDQLLTISKITLPNKRIALDYFLW